MYTMDHLTMDPDFYTMVQEESDIFHLPGYVMRYMSKCYIITLLDMMGIKTIYCKEVMLAKNWRKFKFCIFLRKFAKKKFRRRDPKFSQDDRQIVNLILSKRILLTTSPNHV